MKAKNKGMLEKHTKNKRCPERKLSFKSKLQKKKVRMNVDEDEDDDDLKEDEEACIFFNELYSSSTDREGWIQCLSCN